jgi:2'-5' RNA ligase
VTGTNLVNHWTHAPEWDDNHLLAVYITFADQPAIHAMVDRYQAVLADLPQLDLVRPEWRHLTMLGIAFTHEIAHLPIDRIAADCARIVATQSIPTLIGKPAQVATDSVVIPIEPKRDLELLRHNLMESARELLGGRDPYKLPEPPQGFDPHVTVAYANAAISGTEIENRLATVDYVEATVQIEAMSLIELSRRERTWTWRSERRLPLADVSQQPSSVPPPSHTLG